VSDIIINMNGVSVGFDFSALRDCMTSDERMNLAKSLCWDEVLEEAVLRLAGASDCSSSEDYNLSWEFMADQIVNEALKVRFGAFRRIRESLQDQHFEARMYWKLYHDSGHLFYDKNGDPVTVSRWFREWCESNGFKDSNYCDKESSEWADDVVEKFERLMREEAQKASRQESEEV